MTAAVISHLWASTIVLLLAFAIARFAPRLTARTRYAVLLAGIAKFAVPSALFAPLASLFGGARSGSFLIMNLVHGPIAAPVRTATANAPHWPFIIAIVWASIATLLLLRTFLLHRRTVAAALFGAVPASPREVAALARAKERAGVSQSVDLVRSQIAEAPAVLRIVRPVLVLPPSADALDESELEAILAHECAHVARRDNATGVFESIAGALLWFHPLVLVARRELARRREQACDEVVAEAAGEETYLSALTKVCRAAIAPRVAGVSCMASGQLKERMEHFMSYSEMKSRAFSHRVVVGVTVAAITLLTAGAAIVAAADAAPSKQRYQLTYSVTPRGTKQVVIAASIVDTVDGKLIAAPHVTTQWGVAAQIRTGSVVDGIDREFFAEFEASADGSSSGRLVVTENGIVVQETLRTSKEMLPAADPKKFTGEPISINIKDAELQDIFKVLGQLTGYTILVPAGVTGRVTLNVTNMPWDQALDQICNENGLRYRVEGKTIYITK
jgi:beta-lactamase regulating signal transducer with metallopeptidase domain